MASVNKPDDSGSYSDILNSPSKKSSPATNNQMSSNNDDLPGSVGGNSPENGRRPSTSLEIGPSGEAIMTEGGLPQRLPPLRSTDGEDGLEGYRQNLDFEASEISQRWALSKKSSLTDAKINELMNTLECPVCLDTADSPPIYQCPEGHLLCKQCNQRLNDCPQCGHALMNSRNRIAEDLAMKLQLLNGGASGVVGGQKISIAVSEPFKTRKGLFKSVVYTILTRYGGERSGQIGGNSHYSVTRTYSQIEQLYEFLLLTYKKDGVIVPPPPQKNSLGFIENSSSINGKDLSASTASRAIDKKCVALDRYMKRLARHPVVRKDAMFWSFIQEKEVAKSLKPMVTFKGAMAGMKAKMAVFRSRIAVTEKDPWFQTRHGQLRSLLNQMNEMHKNLRGMAKLKHQLHEESDEFRRDLVLLLVGRSTVKENDFGHIIDQVVDAQRVMSSIYYEQANADDHIVQISGDYAQMIASAQDVLARRRKVQMDLEKATKKSAKKGSKASSKKEEEDSSQAPVVELKDPNDDLEAIQAKFDRITQTVRRELEHFDYVMREEFEKAFAAYNATYWSSLNKTKSIDIANNAKSEFNQRPSSSVEAIEYEEMAAVSYHI